MFPKILPVLAMAANRFFDTSRKFYEVKKEKQSKESIKKHQEDAENKRARRAAKLARQAKNWR